MALQRPAWLKEHLKKQVPDQITILSKSSMYEPISTGNGMDGKPQVAMPVDRMLHERETVLNAATTEALGGKKAVRDMIMGHLSEKGINKMPMPKESTIRQAASNNMQKAGYVTGNMPDMRRMAGYVTGTPFDENSDYTKLTRTGEDAGTEQSRPTQTTTPQLSISGGTAQTGTQDFLAPIPEVKTPTVNTFTNNTPAMPVPTTKPTRLAYSQENLYKARDAGFDSIDAYNASLGIGEDGSIADNATPQDTTANYLRNTGFASMEEATAARKLGITNKKDYDAELAARNAPVQTIGTGAQMPDARGMNTFRQQYDYAAQQADARSAAGQQALAMQMAQNPNLTQGAQNTMIQEQLMARGAQQSKLAGDAAQSAYGIQREQNQKAMDAMLAAGDVDGFAKMFQEEHGIPINTAAMSSTLNQRALSTAANGLNTRIAQLGDRATLDDPLTKNYLESLWAATGNTGTMDAQWANSYLQRERDSYNPVYQAMKFYPEKNARMLWGDETIDGMEDKLTRTTGYEAFQRKYARGMATAFSSYDPATQDFKVANDSFLESLFNPNGSGTRLGTQTSKPKLTYSQENLYKARDAGFDSIDAYNASLGSNADAPAAPTFTYSTIKTGDTVDYNGEKWTVGTDVDGKKVMRSESGKWANVGSDDILNEYTTDNTTGLQTIGGKTYNNGTEVTASVGGKNLAINKDGEGNFVTVGTQRVPVTVGENGKVSIDGSFVDNGKLYVNGKETKTPDGGALSLDLGEQNKLSSGYESAIASSGGKYYRVGKNGSVTKYDSDAFGSEISGLSVADTSMKIEFLKANGENPDSIFKAYTSAGGSDSSIIMKLVGMDSSLAKDKAVEMLQNGSITLGELNSDKIKKYIDSKATVKTTSSSHPDMWDRNQGESFSSGTVIKNGDKYYIVTKRRQDLDSRPKVGGNKWFAEGYELTDIATGKTIIKSFISR